MNYNSNNPPTVVIVDDSGSGASATVGVINNGAIASITVNNGGSGYDSGNPPTVYFSNNINLQHINGNAASGYKPIPGEETWPPGDITLYPEPSDDGLDTMTLPASLS